MEIFKVTAGAQSKKFSNRAVRQVILTGCGYSYAACLAAKDYIQARTHLPVTVLPTIEVARFSDLSGDSLSDTLLVAISNSGMVSRVNEALAVYEKHGAITLGITSNQTAQITQYCRYHFARADSPYGKAAAASGICPDGNLPS